MKHEAKIVELIRALATARSWKESYASIKATGSGDTISRLERDGTLTLRRAERIRKKVSDLWPDDVAWPSEILERL